MGKQSSNKKVQRAARAGTGRKAQRRAQGSVLWPSLISAVVILGVVLIVISRNENRNAVSAERPRLAAAFPEDHWHEAYGVNICGTYQPNIPEAMNGGIHTHGEGLIHIEAENSAETGKNANIGKFVSNVGNGFRITDTELRAPGGKTYKNGDKCGAKSGRVAAYVWDSPTDTEPDVVTNGIAAVRLRDRSMVALSFNPPGTDLAPPASVNELPKQDGAPTETTAPAPGDTTPAPTGTTTAGSPGTTPPAATEGSTASSAPPTTTTP